MKKKLKLKLYFWFLASALSALLFAGMIEGGWFLTWHLKFSNFFYHQFESQASPEIVIVAIDDRSFARKNASELHTLQFSKADYAKVLQNLERAGVKAVGVDIIFSENAPAADKAALVGVLKDQDNVILAAEPKTSHTTGLKPLPDFIFPQAENLGSILFETDKDNLLRRQRIFFEDSEVPFSFSVQLARKALDLLPADSRMTEAGYQLMPFAVRTAQGRVEPITIPLDAKGQMAIRFFGPPGSFPSISFIDAFEDRMVDRETGKPLDLKGKIILIGEMGTGLHDEQYVPTSLGRPMPGVEIHANALQTILSQRFLIEQSSASVGWISAAILVSALAFFLSFGILASIVLLMAGCALYSVIAWFAFGYGLILNTVYPYFALLFPFVAAYVYRYFTETRHARHLENAFSKYVSHHVVREILEHPERLKLGGEKKEMTVLFSDIAGFTTISERTDPEKLVEQLNEYLDAMTGIILDADGTLDKYIGDAIMAFWGAPLPQPDHAVRACLAALDYQNKLVELRRVWQERGQLPFDARIGINTGPMVVGNMGSHRRFDYTVIGDTVNLSARLEGVNKVFDTHILISETAYEAAKEHIEAREIDLLTVKGKTQPVHVYELQARKGQLSESQKDLNRLFSQGVLEYRNQEWEKAIRSFKKALEIDRNDGPSKVYIERCESLKHEEPPEDWDGSYALKTK